MKSLAEENIKLAYHVAHQFRRRSPDYLGEEIEAVALSALAEAERSFDPVKSQFSTHAINQMKWAILRFLRDKASVIKLSRKAHEQGVKFLRYAEINTPEHEGDRPLVEQISGAQTDPHSQTVSQALPCLPAKTQELMILHFYHGFSRREIAKTTGLHAVTVGRKIKEGVEELRRVCCESEGIKNAG